MSLDISSIAGKLNSPAYFEPANRSEIASSPGGLKTVAVKDFDMSEGRPDSIESGILDPMIFSANHQVDYQVNPETHEVIIRVVDSESGEVVRQIPGEEVVKLTQRITEFNQKFLDQTI